MNTTGVEITAGLGGFLVLFGLALAVWFLGRDLSRRLRRSQQREQLRDQEQADQEQEQDPPGAEAAEKPSEEHEPPSG